MALIIDRQTKKKEKNMKATNILWDTDKKKRVKAISFAAIGSC